MKILFAFRHRKAVEPFVDVVEELRDRGHDVAVALHERDERVRNLFACVDGLEFLTLPDRRRDSWHGTAGLARHLRDLVQYLHEPYRHASKLRRRVFDRLCKHIGVPKEVGGRWSGDALVDIGPEAVARVEGVLEHLEHVTPADPVMVQALRRLAPDVVLVTPLLHFGNTQVEVVKASQSFGVPVGMLLFSWDNLSTKGALHVAPNHLFVWNERQRREAFDLHRFPLEHVTITGAPRFDRFFRRSSQVSRGAFCEPLGADPAAAIVLYLCSSRLVSEKEVRFIRQWIGAIRAAPIAQLREATVIVRPHPDLPLAEGRWLSTEHAFRWDGLPGCKLKARTMFADHRNVVLTSDFEAAQVLFESTYHSSAVVGLNTSAEIEAGIVGRPVFTILTDASQADGQHATLHFHYLTRAEGGFVHVADSLDAHVAQLGDALEHPVPPSDWRDRVKAFVRPCGWDIPASQVLAEQVEQMRVSPSVAAAPPHGRAPEEVGPIAESLENRLPAGQLRRPGAPRTSFGNDLSPVAVDVDGGEIWMMAAHGERRVMPDATRISLEWLGSQLMPGAVVYDLTAGDGLFAVAAARRTGWTIVAFEASIPALAALWQNTLMNACDGRIVPVPCRPLPRTGLEQERYDRFAPDAIRRPTRLAKWREHEPATGDGVIQPVLGIQFDWAVRRFRLPPPQALRADLSQGSQDLVAGLVAALGSYPDAFVVLEGDQTTVDSAGSTLGGIGFTLSVIGRDHRGTVAVGLRGLKPAPGPLGGTE